MKKFFAFLILVLASTLPLTAGNAEVIGSWDCEAVVDMTYPFDLVLSEKEGKLGGYAASDMGSLDLSSASFAEGILKFQLEIGEVGIINYEAKLDGKTLRGTLENEMFQGDLSCKKSE